MAVIEAVVGQSYTGRGLPKSIFGYQPLRFFWGLCAIVSNAIQLPFWVVFYLLPTLRPNPKWSLQSAVANHIITRHLWHSSFVQTVTPLSLKPGLEGKKWDIIHPSTKPVYVGRATPGDVRPIALGGTWYPELPTSAEKVNRTTVLHFHGGAFTIGDARRVYSGYAGKTLSKYVADNVVMAGYRLASNKGGQFPAQLQDAISWYQSLLDRGVPASKIVLSGDSAGANLVLQLLRHIAENKGVLPSPGAALLWSPWVDMIAAFHPEMIKQSPRYKTDYIPPGFPEWGAQLIAKGIDALDPYISPNRGPFFTPTPLFIQAGADEVLFDDIVTCYEGFSAAQSEGKKTTTHLHVAAKGNHDIILMGYMNGFKKEATEAAQAARAFLDQNLSKSTKL